jgi:hypothetical protein
MSLEDYPQISEARKNRIFAMSDAELRVEVERGKDSIMPKCVPFMKAVLAEREKIKSENSNEQNQAHQEAVLEQARIANKLSDLANSASSNANKLALLAIVMSFIALLVTIFKNG